MATPAAVLSILVKAQGAQAAIGQLNGVDAAARKAGGGVDDLGKKSARSHATLGKAAKVAGGMALGVAGIGAAAVKAASTYQSSMNTLQAVSGSTASEMQKLSKLAVKLGADVRLPGTSAQDAAEAMTEMIKAGVSLKDTMDGVRSTLVLSAAAGISNKDAAEIASNALNAFKLQGKDVTMVTDQLANTANASSVEIRDVSDSFKMAAAVFSGFQAPTMGAKKAMTELNVAIGLLGNAGIKGSDAGTSLKQMLLQLTGPSNKAKDAMQALFFAAKGNAGSEGELTGALKGTNKERAAALQSLAKLNPALKGGGDIAYTSAGKMRSLKDIITLVAAGTKHMTDEQKNAYITQIFGADATRSVIALMNAGPAAFDKMTAAVTKQGAAQALADAKMKGFKGSMEALKSTLETLAINVGTKLLPALTAIVKGFSSVVSALSPTTWTILIGVIGGTAAAVWLLNAALAANPITLVIVGLAALTAGLVVAYEKSATFRDIVNGAFAALKAAAGVAGPAVVAAVNAVAGAFNAAVGWVRGAMNSIMVEINKWHLAAAVVKAALAVISALIAPWVAVISAAVRAGMAVVTAVFRTAWTVIKAVFSGAFTALKGIISGGAQILSGAVKVIEGILRGDFSRIWEGIKQIFRGGFTALKGLITGAAQAVGGAAKAIGTAIIDAIVGAIKSAGGKIVDAVKGILGSVKGAVGGALGAINPFGDGLGFKPLAPLPTGPSGSLMGARPTLAPFARVGAGFGLHVSSGKRAGGSRTSSGGISYHSTGEAIDLANGRGPDAAKMGAFKALRSRFGSRLAELIYTPGGVGIKNGQPFTYTGKVAADHFDHVHVAFDTGMPGVGDGLGRAGAFMGDGPGRLSGVNLAIDAARKAGFKGTDLVNMIAIAGRESSYSPTAHNYNPPIDDSWGLWQINVLPNANPRFKSWHLSDPYINAKAAHILFSGAGLRPWMHKGGPLGGTNVAAARAAVAAFKGGGASAPTAGGGGSNAASGAASTVAKVNPIDQKIAAADLDIANVEGGGSYGKTFGGRAVKGTAAKIGAMVAKRKLIGRRIQSIRKALKGKLSPTKRLALTQELTQRLGEHTQLGTDIQGLRTGDRPTASDFLTAQTAQAQLTPGLGDDLTAAQATVASATGAYQKAVGTGDPRKIAEAADALKSAADNLSSVTDAIKKQEFDWADAGIALAQLTDTLDDDRAALEKKRALDAAALEDAKARNDPVAITQFAGALRSDIDAIKQLDQTLKDQEEAMKEHTAALKAVGDELKRQTDLASAVQTTEAFQLKKYLADVLSGQIGGYGVVPRSYTPGSGVAHRY